MAQESIDATVQCQDVGQRQNTSIEVLNCEMPDRYQKDRGKRVIRSILNKLRLKRTASVDISQPDPIFKVAYLGNVVTGWAKGDGCVEKPLATLWRNYTQSSRPDVTMELTVSGGGLKATTKDHGLTEYWANRLTSCEAPPHFPRIFCWVYRHEGRRLRHELRCHAVLCSSSTVARQIETALKNSLYLALTEFKRDKISRQNARLSLANSIYDNPTMPRRKILLSTGSHNYRPPLERSKSAPKLMSIEENLEEEEDDGYDNKSKNEKLLGNCTKRLLNIRRHSLHNDAFKTNPPRRAPVPVIKDTCACDNLKNGNERRESVNRVTFSENNNLEIVDNTDEKINLTTLEILINESLKREYFETSNEVGERNWFRNGKDVINLDSDEGSLSSGCESSSSTVTSDLEQAHFSTIDETQEESEESTQLTLENKKTECDFKLGSFALLNRVKKLERLNGRNLSASSNILIEEVSLIPVGESHSDFSSLKVYKRRSNSDSGLNINVYSIDSSLQTENEENALDEGYDEVIDCASSVSNIVLV